MEVPRRRTQPRERSSAIPDRSRPGSDVTDPQGDVKPATLEFLPSLQGWQSPIGCQPKDKACLGWSQRSLDFRDLYIGQRQHSLSCDLERYLLFPGSQGNRPVDGSHPIRAERDIQDSEFELPPQPRQISRPTGLKVVESTRI